MTKRLVIIPVFNEADTIRGVLAELRMHYCGDVLLVDDGSTDNSIKSIASCDQTRLHIIRHPVNRGYGASLIDGFDYAIKEGYDALVTMDCDWQHEPAQVLELFQALEGVDILSGSRYLKKFLDDVEAPIDRKQINYRITKSINDITSYNLTDSFCGFKAYRVAALRQLELDEPGYGFPLQFWIQAFCMGLRVAEIPVKRIYRNVNRSFGNGIDDPMVREAYYLRVINRELEKCQSIAW